MNAHDLLPFFIISTVALATGGIWGAKITPKKYGYGTYLGAIVLSFITNTCLFVLLTVGDYILNWNDYRSSLLFEAFRTMFFTSIPNAIVGSPLSLISCFIAQTCKARFGKA